MKQQITIEVDIPEGYEFEGYVVSNPDATSSDELSRPIWLDFKKKEPERWRAVEGERFFYVDSDGLVCAQNDYYESNHDDMYNSGNYLRTDAEAVEARKRIRKTLSDYHKEILSDE